MTSHQLSGDIPTPPSLSLPSADGPFEAEEGKAECSAVLPDENAAIDRLPDELLEEIFRFDSLDHISIPPLYGSELWDWHRLVHVCQRWRYIIFNASRSLELRLFCTHGTPVKKNLDCWPVLPIILQYLLSPNPSLPPVDEDDVIAALRHPDRICTMQLTVTTSLSKKLTTLAQERFPVLECLELFGESDKEPILLNEFLVGPFPSLRILRLTRVVFPALQRILPFSKDLVYLLLEDLPYLTPAALRNVFPGMTNLEELYLFFNSPISRPIPESGRNNPANPPPCRAVLPALKFVQFCGTSEDLECLLSSTEAPVLRDIHIKFFNQATIFDTSQFVQFLSRKKTKWSHDYARMQCSKSDISVALIQETRHQMALQVECTSLDWQLSCMAEICANLSLVVSDVQRFDIDASFPFPSEHGDMDPLPLLELFRPFSKVTMLFLSDTVASYVKYALKQEVAMELLPNAREMEIITPETRREQRGQEFRKWLSPPDPSTNHNIARNIHHDGTTIWFSQSGPFKDWLLNPSLFWIHGKPGSGKTIMCSAVIEEIRILCNAGLAFMGYFYFDFRDEDKKNHRNLLLSLLLQLSDQSDIYCDILSRLHSAHNGTQSPSEDDLTNCLKEMLSFSSRHHIWLIMDALDECPNTYDTPSPREQVLELVKDLVVLHLPNLHICVTSRPEADIRAILEPLSYRRVSLDQQSGQREDIIDYINFVVYSDVKMQRWRAEDKKLVIKTLSEKADGMFRWLFCQLEKLRRCPPRSVQRILGELPKKLDETYERVLREITKTNHALCLLQCLVVAIRPLRAQELAEVLAVDFDAAQQNGIPKLNPDWRWHDQENAILTACSSLVAIVDEDVVQFPVVQSPVVQYNPVMVVQDNPVAVVQFAHFSVKEFLTSTHPSRDIFEYYIALEPAHTTLAQACLAVLLQLDTYVNETDASDIPLVGYAARYWVDHARFENVSSRVRVAMEYFFDADKPHWPAWLRIYDMDQSWWAFKYSYQMGGSPLYYASLCGFFDLVEQLVSKHPQDVIAEGGRMKTSLVAALYGKHFRIAELLHRHGADVDVRDDIGSTPLQSASNDGLVDVARWLLDHGADVNSQDKTLSTSLHLASQKAALDDASHLPNDHDQLDIMRLLLEHGADANAQDNAGSTPLHVLCSRGKESSREAIRLLLCSGANIGAENNEGKTALQLASEKGYYGIVELLSELGAS